MKENIINYLICNAECSRVGWMKEAAEADVALLSYSDGLKPLTLCLFEEL